MERSIRSVVGRLPWLLAPAAAVVAELVRREHVRIGWPWTTTVAELVGGVSLIAAGLVIWRSRPANRCWWLLVGAGFAWFVGDFEHSVNEDVSLLAFVFRSWQGLFLAWVLLAYPTGRLHDRGSRALLVVLGGLFALRSLSRALLHVPPDVAGYGTRNRFLPVTDERWWRLVEDGFAWTYSAAIVAVMALTTRRWFASGPSSRRMLTPALIAGALLTASVAYEYVIGWNATIPRIASLRIHQVMLWTHVLMAVSLAIGLLRLRRTRSRVVELVAGLGDGISSDRLGDALARALGDSSVRLLPWSSPRRGYVGSDGIVADLAQVAPTRAVTHIEHHGQPVAALVHDAALLEDPGLVGAVAAAVRITIDNDRLHADLADQLAELAESRARIVDATDAERRRIERDLHDGAQQRLVTVALALRLAETRLDHESDPALRNVLGQAVKELGEAISELRDLARGVHPAILSESGLAAALESLADRSAMPLRLHVDLVHEPPSSIAATAYFAVCEALANVAKHANASDVEVRADDRDGRIVIVVTDDGVGGAEIAAGTGLRGIGDRVATVGGTLRVVSPAGCGTRFEVELPCVSS